MDLLESTPNVRGVFHGHNHNEAKMWVSGQRRYFFDSHVGGSWGAPKGYRIVEVDDKHNMLTYQVDAENKVENRELANITYNRSFSHEKAVENITLERKID